MDVNKSTRGRKPRAPKRPRKTQTESDETTPKRRTRATALSEVLHSTSMYAAPSQVPDMSAAYSMPQRSSTSTSRSTTTSCAYSPQAHFTAFRMRPRLIPTPQTSTSYFKPPQLPHMPATTAMSETNEARGSYQTSSTSLPRPQLPHLSATAIMLESNTAPGIPEDEVTPGCSTQCQMPEVPTYHAMAERTRAAKKMLENRSRYATTLQTPELSIHPIPPSASATQKGLPDLSASYKSQPSSTTHYNTRRAVPNQAINVATSDNYWSNPTNRTFLTQQNQTKSINKSSKKTKIQSVQTDISMTEEETKLLKILRIKRLDPSKWHINIQDDDYTVTYNQVQEIDKKSNSLHNIVRSSDLIKSSLINFYNNAIQQSNVPQISMPAPIGEPQYQYCSNTVANNSDQVNSPSPSSILQNINQENVIQNQKLKQALLGNREKLGKNSPTFTQPEVHQPKISEYFQIPTVAGNRDFNNYTNSRCYEEHQQVPRGSQGHRILHPNSPSDFFHFAQFMDPRFLPPAIRQTFEQYGMPGWF